MDDMNETENTTEKKVCDERKLREQKRLEAFQACVAVLSELDEGKRACVIGCLVHFYGIFVR